jgi:hypothetical protein
MAQAGRKCAKRMRIARMMNCAQRGNAALLADNVVYVH